MLMAFVFSTGNQNELNPRVIRHWNDELKMFLADLPLLFHKYDLQCKIIKV